MTNGAIVTVGAVGSGTSFLAWYISHRGEMIQDLQVLTLLAGLTVSVITIFKLLKKRRKNNAK